MTHALPVAFYLKDLGGDAPTPIGRGHGLDASSDVQKRIADAHALGVLEARAAAQVELDKALAAQAAQFERKLVAERQKWSADQGARLGEAVTKSMLEIERGIAEQVGRVLKPIVAERIMKKAAEDLAATLNGMLSKGDYAKITISGPGDLLSAVEAKLGTFDGVSFVTTDSVDVVVNADETILETQIGAWVAAIGEGQE